ncbi:MAG: DUF503 domain-containing protein [Actinobacteria bacterium]|nr:DUF503 domain-containing protein [Actinomycetota bacterium]
MPRGFVGIVTADLRFRDAGSLKDKRVHLRRVRDRLQGAHAASFAEIGYQDQWQRSLVVFAVAASSMGVLKKRMSAAVGFLDGGDWELATVVEEVVEVDGE